MKKYLSFVLVLSLLITAFACFGLSNTSAAGIFMVNPHEENNLINPIANAQKFSGEGITEAVKNSKNISIAYVNAADVDNLTDFLKACKSKNAIPTVNVADTAEADTLLAAVKASGIKDINAVSADTEAVAKLRSNVFIRTGVAVEIKNATISSKEANEIRCTVRSAPATFCVIKSTNATKQVVSELQELAVSVWVEVDAEANTDAFTAEAVKALTSGANGIISADSALVTKIINDNFASNTMTRTPIMIGHRGNPSQAPENSIAGFLASYENGADVFEIDVEITSDQQLIILHDGTLNRTTNYTGTKKVSQMTLAEIKEYFLKDKAGNLTEEKVPTLREVCEAFKDKDCRIFVEFKGSNMQNVAKAAAIFKEYDMEDRIDVISAAYKFLTQTQTTMPGISTGFLTSYSLKTGSYAEAVNNLPRPMADAQKYNSTINTAAGIYNIHFQQAVVDRGMTVWPWTYIYGSNDTPFMAACDGLTTDDVQWAKDMAKYVEANVSNAEVGVNDEVSVAVNAVTYGRANIEITADNQIVTVLTGKDVLKVENGKITAVAEGDATVIFGYATKTTSGSEYVLYSQPVTVTVKGEGSGDSAQPDSDNNQSDENNGNDAASTGNIVLIVFIIVDIIAVAVAIVLVIVKRKKKNK